MQALYTTNLFMHATAGAIGLVSMFVPLLCKKGSRLHRGAGWVFTAAMATVAVTGVLMALSWVLVPLQVKPPSRVLDAAEQARYLSMLRTYALFFGFLAVLVGSATWQGIVAIRQRRRSIAWGNSVDRGFAAALLGLGALLLLVGISEEQPLLIGFGGLGLFNGVGDLRFYRQMKRERGAWLLRHVQAMLGGATAATTAFAVQVVGRTLSNNGLESWGILAWVVPGVLGMLTSVAWSRRVRRMMTPGYTRG
ncbi:MAG: hypothetical protein K0V04_34925 [Deltaproteobacteria bacterium]|nr:hypothetical protein [Deltaproteobacteria bacterium]